MNNKKTTRARAIQLLESHRNRAPFTPFSDTAKIDSLDEAYEIQRNYVELLLEEENEEIAGYKIGLTSERMQKLLDIDSPIAGVITRNRVLPSLSAVTKRSFVNLGIEYEIAVLIGADLPPKNMPYERTEVEQAVEAVAPAVELVDDRSADYGETDIGSLIADNSWNAGLVVGEFCNEWPSLESVEGIAYLNGKEIDRGYGKDVLGHPFEPLLWLVNHLAKGPRGLKSGDVIATGSLVPTRFPVGREETRFEVSGLGSVTVKVED